MAMVELEAITDADSDEIKSFLEKHIHYTHSPRAKSLLDGWEESRKKFIKVIPTEYKRALKEKLGASA